MDRPFVAKGAVNRARQRMGFFTGIDSRVSSGQARPVGLRAFALSRRPRVLTYRLEGANVPNDAVIPTVPHCVPESRCPWMIVYDQCGDAFGHARSPLRSGGTHGLGSWPRSNRSKGVSGMRKTTRDDDRLRHLRTNRRGGHRVSSVDAERGGMKGSPGSRVRIVSSHIAGARPRRRARTARRGRRAALGIETGRSGPYAEAVACEVDEQWRSRVRAGEG
jgi:hypothetical protein